MPVTWTSVPEFRPPPPIDRVPLPAGHGGSFCGFDQPGSEQIALRRPGCEPIVTQRCELGRFRLARAMPPSAGKSGRSTSGHPVTRATVPVPLSRRDPASILPLRSPRANPKSMTIRARQYTCARNSVDDVPRRQSSVQGRAVRGPGRPRRARRIRR
jgi:hypothetical protein